jgi:hypothetical protein
MKQIKKINTLPRKLYVKDSEWNIVKIAAVLVGMATLISMLFISNIWIAAAVALGGIFLVTFTTIYIPVIIDIRRDEKMNEQSNK